MSPVGPISPATDQQVSPAAATAVDLPGGEADARARDRLERLVNELLNLLQPSQRLLGYLPSQAVKLTLLTACGLSLLMWAGRQWMSHREVSVPVAMQDHWLLIFSSAMAGLAWILHRQQRQGEALPHSTLGWVVACAAIAYGSVMWVNQPWPTYFLPAMLVILPAIDARRHNWWWSVGLTVEAGWIWLHPAGEWVISPEGVRLLGTALVLLMLGYFLQARRQKAEDATRTAVELLSEARQTVLKELEETQKARQQVQWYDAETGLLSAKGFDQWLQPQLAQRDRALPWAVVAVRFDLSPALLLSLTADQQLQTLGLLQTRLLASLCEASLCRSGTLTFVGTFQGAADEGLEETLEQERRTWAHALKLDTLNLPFNPAVGVAVFPLDGESATVLRQRAISAVRTVEPGAEQRVKVFSALHESQLADRASLINSLGLALDAQQFQLSYQPIFSAHDHRIIKAEALLRWIDPVRGKLQPSEFIPLAESSGQIVPITHWVLEQAARQVKQWREDLHPNFQISVNTPPQFLSWCAQQSEESLARFMALDIPPRSIILEITDGSLLNVTEEVFKVLSLLKMFGFDLALDDFGVGYSSFSMLDRLPLDYIKLDKSLIDHMETAPRRQAVCRALIKMAHDLDFRVVVEGVENIQQAELLLDAGGDYLQGYVLSAPLELAAFQDYVLRYREEVPEWVQNLGWIDSRYSEP